MVSSPPVTVGIVVDSIQAQLAIKDIMDQADAATRDWQKKRATILTGIAQATTLIASLMSSFRQVMSLIGAQIDPFFSALIGMVLATTSMLISVGMGLAATGIGSAAAAAVLAVAIGLQVLTMTKLIADQTGISEAFHKMNVNLTIAMQGRDPNVMRLERFGF